MAYIGKQPVVGNFVKLDAITTSATATYNLLNGGVAYFPQTANNCIVSLNGVIQSPTSAYTISGSTIVFSDALTASDSIDFILVLGDVLSIGTPSDGTITSAKLASGTAGLIAWQSVQTTGFTAVAGRGYPCNTTSAAFTVTLPATPSVGDTIILLDYAGTFDTNNLTVNPNSNKIEGGTANLLLTGDREGVTLTYIDSTQGWLATSGIQEGTDSLAPVPYSVDFLVIAGGGSGGEGNGGGGGGGAGGYRTSTQSVAAGTVITVTVGDGGAEQTASNTVGNPGSNSSISGSGLTTITSAGGGGGGAYNTTAGANGGSGGGGGASAISALAGGSGNTPSTSPSQGNNGGTGFNGSSNFGGAGGGGANSVGSNGTSAGGGNGGNGTASSITGSSVTRAGGGGGSTENGTKGTGGSGGGGNGGQNATDGVAGTANTGGGGGAGGYPAPYRTGKAGGKGVVILSMPDASYSGTTTGSPTVATGVSGKTVLTFNGSGSYTG